MTGINVDGRAPTIAGRGVQSGPVSSLPDGAVHQWKLDEGSGQPVDNIGGLTFQLTSAPTWVSDSKFVGGYVLDFSGGDYYMELDSTDGGTIGNTIDNTPFAVAVTLDQYDSTNYRHIMHHQPDGEYSWSFSNSSSGNIDFGARYFGYGSGQFGEDFTGYPTPTRVLHGVDNSGNQFYSFNGGNLKNSGGNVNYTSGTKYFMWGWKGGNGGIGSYEGILDNIIVYDREPSNSLAQEDYDLQPWS